jgi:translation initiation factor IF-3
MSGSKFRMNADITAPEVSLIGADGSTRVVMPTSEALQLAQRHGLDLVEIEAAAHPPVCKILDFEKYKYETAKAQVRARSEDVEFEIRDNQIKEKE